MANPAHETDPAKVLEEPRLRLHLFGTFALRVSHRAPVALCRPARWLLALLALQAETSVSREWLADALWQEAAPERALFYLRRTLAELRAALGDERCRISSPTRATLRFDLSGAFCDVRAFDRLATNADEASLREAIALYAGDLLADCDLEWIVSERAFRRERHLATLEMLAQRREQAGDLHGAAWALQRILIADPLREAAHCRLLEVLGRAGDYAGVERQYRELRRRLRADLNIEPSAETAALYRKLQRQAQATPTMTIVSPGASPPSCRRLPCPLTSLIGRERDRQEVRDALQSARLVTLTGTAGVGKTRLAIAVAGDLRTDYADGVSFVDLTALQQEDGVAPTVAAALGIRADDLPASEALIRYLQQKYLLLVLDNCEHLADACARLTSDLLRDCPQLRLLCTSRQPLHICGEQLQPIAPLETPTDPEPGCDSDAYAARLPDCESVSLLLDRVATAAPAFRLTSRNAASMARICRRLDGLPLALELVAARFRSLTPHEIAARLDDRFRLLASGDPNVLRHQTLRAALDWSYCLLSNEERLCLNRLGIFVGGFTLAAAETVCQGRGIARDEIAELVSQLVDHSLIVFDDQAIEGRYRLLETIRVYARQHLDLSGDAARCQRRHAACYAALVRRAQAAMRGAEEAEWYARFDREQDNLRAVLDCCHRSERSARGLRMAIGLHDYWTTRAHLREGVAWLSAFLERPDELPAAIARDGWNALARVELIWCHLAEAERHYQAALLLSRATGSSLGAFQALNGLGAAAHQTGDNERAKPWLEEALVIARRIGAPQYIARVMCNLGNVSKEMGDYEAALAWYREALRLHQESGHRSGVALTLYCQGLVQFMSRRYVEALSLFEQSLTTSRELGLSGLTCGILRYAGWTRFMMGDFAAAVACGEEALLLALKRDHLDDICNVHAFLCYIHLRHGDRVQASHHLLQALQFGSGSHDNRCRAFIVLVVAHFCLDKQRFEQAARLLGASKRLCSGICDVASVARHCNYWEACNEARLALGDQAFETAYEKGSAMPDEAIFPYALASIVGD